jgi:hypothetical protein
MIADYLFMGRQIQRPAKPCPRFQQFSVFVIRPSQRIKAGRALGFFINRFPAQTESPDVIHIGIGENIPQTVHRGCVIFINFQGFFL